MAVRRVIVSSAVLLLLLGFSFSIGLSGQPPDYQKFEVISIINHGLLNGRSSVYFLAGYDYLTRPRGRKYFSIRTCLYSANADITFNLKRLATSGDINPNPGPTLSMNSTKTSCSICLKTVAKTHRAIECDICSKWCHITCGGISLTEYRNLQNTRSFVWTCPTYISDLQLLPFATISDSEIDELNLHESFHSGVLLNDSHEVEPDRLQTFLQPYKRNFKLAHLNVNSIAGFKFHVIKTWLLTQLFDVLVLTETKIDESLPDSHFAVEGCRFMRCDRSIRGGGVMIFWRSNIVFHHTQMPILNKLEAISIKLKIGKKWLLVIGAYRPPSITSALWYDIGAYRPPSITSALWYGEMFNLLNTSFYLVT